MMLGRMKVILKARRSFPGSVAKPAAIGADTTMLQGKLYRRGQEVHRARLTRSRELARELREIGFRVRTVRGYGRFSFGRGHVGFVARKDLSSAPDTRANRTSPLQSATSTLGRPLRPTLSATR